MAFRSLEKLINLHDGYRRVFLIDGLEMLLIQEAGERWLIGRRCPHARQALDSAEIDGGAIRCSRHGYRFSLRDGQPLAADCDRLRIFDLVYEGNSLGVDFA